jgi:hypothetical protein
MLAVAILVLASIPGTLCAAEEAGGNPAPVVATVSQPAPSAPALPVQVNLPNQTPAPHTPQAIDNKPTFLITTCSQCVTSTGCRRLHSCVLMGCC